MDLLLQLATEIVYNSGINSKLLNYSKGYYFF